MRDRKRNIFAYIFTFLGLKAKYSRSSFRGWMCGSLGKWKRLG